jgi:DNA-binding response OmpR family regulator
MARKPLVLIVGARESCHPLAGLLQPYGFQCVCLETGAQALQVIEKAEKDGVLIGLVFLSCTLKQAQLEWLILQVRSRSAFETARVIVVGAENASKVKYWLGLGANSCLGSDPDALLVAAQYWASVFLA